MRRGASSVRHVASSAASAGPFNGGVQNTRQCCLVSTPPAPASALRSASPDLAPSSLAWQATTRPPGAAEATARASSARASSRWRGGSTSTRSKRSPSSAPGSSRTCRPARCSASANGLKPCSQVSAETSNRRSAPPSRARRNSTRPPCGHASAPCANGSSRTSRGASLLSATRKMPRRNRGAFSHPRAHGDPIAAPPLRAMPPIALRIVPAEPRAPQCPAAMRGGNAGAAGPARCPDRAVQTYSRGTRLSPHSSV